MAVNIRERVSGRVLPENAGSADTGVNVTARRFAGVLCHPVPRSEMLHSFGIDRPGYKITVDWPGRDHSVNPIQVGEVLDLEGRRYPILGIKEVPVCHYMELYTGEAQ